MAKVNPEDYNKVWNAFSDLVVREGIFTAEVFERNKDYLRTIVHSTLDVYKAVGNTMPDAGIDLDSAQRSRLVHIIIGNVYNDNIEIEVGDVAIDQIIYHLQSEGWKLIPPK